MFSVTREELAQTLRLVFPRTLPVMAGYLILGSAYGVLMQKAGLGVGWTFLTSFLVYAGSMQYAALALFVAPFNPLYALGLALIVNARHVFYGLAMLEKVKGTGRLKNYIVFTLTDEAFSLLSSHDLAEDVDQGLYMFLLTFLCRWYWQIASVFGALLGTLISFNTQGLEFSLTSMFVVIFLNQWQNRENRISSLIGLFAAILALLLFGRDNFMIPAMVLTLIVLTIFSKKMTKGVVKDGVT